MEERQDFKIGDLVQLQIYIRKPKLQGIILENLGFNEKINDIIFKILVLTRSGLMRHYYWTLRTIRKL